MGSEEINCLSLLLDAHVDFIKDYLQENNNTSKNSEDENKRKADDDEIKDAYEKVMNSYQELFCRRCLTYDCYKHGNLKKPDMKFQFALALKKEKDQQCVRIREKRKINATDANNIVPTPLENGNAQSSAQTTLTSEQKALLPPLYQIFNGDLDIISNHLEVPKELLPSPENVQPYVSFDIIPPQPKRKKSTNNYTSMANYNQNWVKRIEESTLKPLFYPCTHTEPCSEATCPCVQKGQWCTKHCVSPYSLIRIYLSIGILTFDFRYIPPNHVISSVDVHVKQDNAEQTHVHAMQQDVNVILIYVKIVKILHVQAVKIIQ